MGKKKAGKRGGGAGSSSGGGTSSGAANTQNASASPKTAPTPMSQPAPATAASPVPPSPSRTSVRSTQANGSSIPNGNHTPSRTNSTMTVPEERPAAPEVNGGIADPAIDDPEQLREQGNNYFKQREFDIAADLYSSAIALKQDPTYYTNRAAAYMGLKRFKQALDDCQTAASLQSSSPSSRTLARLARCHLALGDPTAAIRNAQLALELDPANRAVFKTKADAEKMQSHLDRSRKAWERKDFGEAKWALGEAMTACEGEYPLQWRIWRIEYGIARKEWDDAGSLAVSTLRSQPNSPDALAVRGLYLFLTNQLAPCQEHLRSALRMDQEHARARKLLRRIKDVERTKDEGSAFFRDGKHAEAVAKWTETLDIIGTADEEGGGGHIRSILLSNRATTLLKMKEYERALEDTLIALELLPTSWKALRTQARIRMAQEEYEEAVKDFKRAVDAVSSDDGSNDTRSLADELRRAEVALKRSQTKDYYKILNVHREATEIEIKKAYRKESLIHHPDKGGNEEQFKLVSEAYSVLSSSERRDRYDRGEDEDGMNEGGFGGAGMSAFDLNDIIFNMSGGPFSGGGGGGRRGGGGFSFAFS